MKLKTLIVLLILIQSGLASGEEKLLEFPCQGGAVLIQPKIKLLPEGYGIHFVTTWGNNPPYVLISDSEGEYEAKVITNNNIVNNKYMGYVIAKSTEILSIQFDGCQVQWGVPQ